MEKIVYIIRNIYRPRPPVYVERARWKVLQISVIPCSYTNQCKCLSKISSSSNYTSITSKNTKKLHPNSIFYFNTIF